MKCPFCKSKKTKVINSRFQEESNRIRRRRLCEDCENRFTTFEHIETIPIFVIKKNGIREQFDRNKVLSGLLKACYKRPIPISDIENLIDEIENKLLFMLADEIESNLIGELIMEKLKKMDEIAYVRFASVYRQFKDINSFLDELNKILTEKND